MAVQTARLLFLRCQRQESSRIHRAANRAAPDSLSSTVRIFLVENHPVTLACVRRHLEQRGHEVETAETIADTLRELPAKPCDLLIADLGLPDGDGCALLESLGAARPPLAVAMSGFGSAADQARSRAAGFQQHLTKPFLPAELDRVLNQIQAAQEVATAISASATRVISAKER